MGQRLFLRDRQTGLILFMGRVVTLQAVYSGDAAVN
jgi:hypothetical protein